ncbi:MAG: hypothetical protein RMJ98_06245 [Myxococcales bacterium]|nr:hypothetical protein [Polyangiaceae bacterium]MDW8248889.1 hypothetical protein [Myxococcales bacterium]
MKPTSPFLRPRHRFPVDLRDDPEALEAHLERHLRLLPTGSARRVFPFGIAFRREPDAFSAIAAGPMLGTALLLAEYTRRTPFFSRVGLTLSLLFLALSCWFLWRFFHNALARFEVLAEGHEVVLRSRVGRFVTETSRHDAEGITAVVVIQPEGETPRVMLGGPRHALVGEVFRARPLDPDRLAAWMAEGAALVARWASLAPRP